MTDNTVQTPAGWTFNKDYNDLEQVRPYLPAFLTRLAELEAAGKYRYNDSFKGHVPGIEGPAEDTAIYLLQGLEHQQRDDARVAALIRDGYVTVDAPNGDQRYAHVVLYPTRRMGGEWAEWREARILPRNGKPYAVIPKGKRTHGSLINGRRVLARLTDAT